MTNKQFQLSIKDLADRAIAATMLLLLSPILLVTVIAIWFDDRGPAFFSQERVGRQQRPFRVLKFRTMVVNADHLLEAGGRVGSQNRITRVGKVLRKWSLDELPQLVNVLTGDMSLVGPRPVLPSHIRRYSPEQCRRFEMKPGITGLAQVSGRNTLKWSRRLELDVQYADQYSLIMDASILLRTIIVVLSHEGLVMDRNPQQVDDLPEFYIPGPVTPDDIAA